MLPPHMQDLTVTTLGAHNVHLQTGSSTTEICHANTTYYNAIMSQ